MSYKYSKGSTVQGDIKAADDTQRDTLIDFGEDQIDLQTSGSTRVSITNTGATINGTLFVDAQTASSNEGIRFKKTGQQYRQMVFESDSNDAAQIQLDNAEQLNIDQLNSNKEIRLRIIGGGNEKIVVSADGVQIKDSMLTEGGIIASGSAASIGGDVTDAAIYSSGSILMEDSTAALNLDLEIMSKRSRTRLSSVAGSNNSAIMLERSRASNAAVQNGDKLGQIEFYGNDGSSMIRGGAIECTVNGSPGSNDMPGKISILTTADGSNTPSEIIGVQSTGVMFNQAYTFPTSDGSADQVLQTNGSGQLSFVDVDGGGGGGGSGGKVLQVAHTAYSASAALSTNTFQAISGFEVAITPSATSSKVLLHLHINVALDNINQSGGHNLPNIFGILKIRRFVTGNNNFVDAGVDTNSSNNNTQNDVVFQNISTSDAGSSSEVRNKVYSMTLLDSPNTTNTIRYQVETRTGGGANAGNPTLYVNRTVLATNNLFHSPGISTITAMEIDGS